MNHTNNFIFKSLEMSQDTSNKEKITTTDENLTSHFNFFFKVHLTCCLARVKGEAIRGGRVF